MSGGVPAGVPVPSVPDIPPGVPGVVPGFVPYKINDRLSFPLVLDMRELVLAPSSDDMEYDLTGVVVHDGNSSNTGHYYSIIRDDSGAWLKFNDLIVTPYLTRDIPQECFGGPSTKSAYMLFYRKKDPLPTPVANRVLTPVSPCLLSYVTVNLIGRLVRPLATSYCHGD